MKQVKDNTGLVGNKIKEAASSPLPQPPPPPPPLPRLWVRKTVTESVTNQEIAKFWRQKRIEEEDHLLAAIKAAACIRARKLSEEDYKSFVDSLEDDNKYTYKEENMAATGDSNKDEQHKEIRVGIKDWWTKSKFAYLNQPAVESTDPPKRRASTYVPNCFNFKPRTPLYPTFLGVY